MSAILMTRTCLQTLNCAGKRWLC